MNLSRFNDTGRRFNKLIQVDFGYFFFGLPIEFFLLHLSTLD